MREICMIFDYWLFYVGIIFFRISYLVGCYRIWVKIYFNIVTLLMYKIRSFKFLCDIKYGYLKKKEIELI